MFASLRVTCRLRSKRLCCCNDEILSGAALCSLAQALCHRGMPKPPPNSEQRHAAEGCLTPLMAPSHQGMLKPPDGCRVTLKCSSSLLLEWGECTGTLVARSSPCRRAEVLGGRLVAAKMD